jgi:PAS domain S-box-containing protein
MKRFGTSIRGRLRLVNIVTLGLSALSVCFFLVAPFSFALRSEASEPFPYLVFFGESVFLVCLGCMVLLFFLFSSIRRKVVNPILRLSAEVKGVSLNNGCSMRVGPFGTDEVDQLAVNINELLSQIQKRDEEIDQRQSKLENEVRSRTSDLDLVNKQLKTELAGRERMAQALTNAASQWRTSFDAIGDCVCLLDADGAVLRCNKAMADFLKKPFVDILERKIDDIVYTPAGVGISVGAERIRALRSRETFTVLNGARWFDVTIDPIRDEGGDTTGCVHIMTDVTERRQVDEGLKLFKALIDQSNDAFEIADPSTGQFLDVNERSHRDLGYSREEFLALHVWDIDPTVDPSVFTGKMEEIRESGLVHEGIHRRKDGSIFPVEVNLKLVRLDRDYLVSVVRNITERKRAEEALRLSEEKFRKVVENASDGICILMDGLVGYVNPALYYLLGYTLEERPAEDPSFIEYIHPDELPHVLSQYQKHLSGEEAEQHYETALRHKDGHRLDVDLSATWIDDYEGRLAPLIFIHDITEHKRAEEALRQSETLHHSLVDHLPQRVFIKDRNSVYLSCNASYAGDLGIAPDQIVGKDDFAFFPTELAERYRADDQTVMNAAIVKDIEEPYRVAEGERWVHTIKVPFHDEKGQVIGVLGIFEDITEHKRAEQVLRESEEKYRLLAENASDVIFVVDMDLKSTYVSPAVERLRGYTVEEALKQPIDEWLTSVSLDRTLEAFKEELARDGLPGVDPGRTRTLELEELKKDGTTVWVEMTCRFLRDERGLPTGILGVARDITGRKKLEDQLVQSQKMDAIGRLAGGVAHDFNNILSVITSYSGFLLDEIPAGSPLRLDVEEIKKAADRAAALTRQLLAFSRRQVVNPAVLNVNDVINNLSKMLKRIIGEHIRMSLRFSDEAGQVFMDPSQLEQILVNLVVNARDAMPRGGRLVIETARSIVTPENHGTFDDSVPGEYVVVSVADNGVGMDGDLVKRIFEPFFTTKPVGKGTGLGLSMVYGAAHQNGGFVKVDSEPGSGTTFRVYLKRHAGDEVDAEVAAGAEQATKGRGETILLVEDEEPVRRVVRKILEANGYRVVEAADGGEALAAFQEQPDGFALVISDVVMPGMSGIEMARRIHESRPGQRVLHMSGYTDEVLADQGVTDERTFVLTKPFERDLLLTKMRGILDKKAAPDEP